MECYKLLIVEKDPSKRLMLGMYLTEIGSLHGSHLIGMEELNADLLGSDYFDFIIVDLTEPEIGLTDLIIKIRKMVHTPIIFANEILGLEDYTDPNIEKVFYVKDILNFDKLNNLLIANIGEAINLPYLNEIAEIGMPEPEILIDKIAITFKDVVPKKFQEIDNLFQKEQYEALSKVAHGLRSTCYNVGAHHFAEALKELEECARKGVIPYNRQYWLKKLGHEFMRAEMSLQNVLANKLYLKKNINYE
jgi:HPt (histidine-containing phosphotransfer) domain-containing protein